MSWFRHRPKRNFPYNPSPIPQEPIKENKDPEK